MDLNLEYLQMNKKNKQNQIKKKQKKLNLLKILCKIIQKNLKKQF